MNTHKTLREALWARVQVGSPDECWPWLGARNKDGYGHLKYGGKYLKAHRVAYELVKGAIPEGKYICHSCDNPPCCNPSHLFVGTQADNMQDMYSKGRESDGTKVKRGMAHHATTLTDDQVREIRQRRAEGATYTELSSMYGVSRGTVHRIVHRVGWAHID